MLRSAKEIIGYHLRASDDDLGRVEDFLFDDLTWTVRYVAADTRVWLPGRKVLLSPAAAGDPEPTAGVIPLQLTKKQIQESPPLQSELPVSRQHEAALAEHYGWPFYWLPGAVGAGAPALEHLPIPGGPSSTTDGGPHLRSVAEVLDYHVLTRDGDFGRIADVIIETESWIITSLVIDTREWFSGKQLLIVPESIQRVEWLERTVYVDLTEEEIRKGPEYDPRNPVNARLELRHYDYHGRPAGPES